MSTTWASIWRSRSSATWHGQLVSVVLEDTAGAAIESDEDGSLYTYTYDREGRLTSQIRRIFGKRQTAGSPADGG